MSEGTSLSHTPYFFLSALRLLSGCWLQLHSCWGWVRLWLCFCFLSYLSYYYQFFTLLIDSLSFEFKFIYFHFCWSNLISQTISRLLPQFSQVSYCYPLLSLSHKPLINHRGVVKYIYLPFICKLFYLFFKKIFNKILLFFKLDNNNVEFYIYCVEFQVELDINNIDFQNKSIL